MSRFVPSRPSNMLSKLNHHRLPLQDVAIHMLLHHNHQTQKTFKTLRFVFIMLIPLPTLGFQMHATSLHLFCMVSLRKLNFHHFFDTHTIPPSHLTALPIKSDNTVRSYNSYLLILPYFRSTSYDAHGLSSPSYIRSFQFFITSSSLHHLSRTSHLCSVPHEHSVVSHNIGITRYRSRLNPKRNKSERIHRSYTLLLSSSSHLSTYVFHLPTPRAPAVSMGM